MLVERDIYGSRMLLDTEDPGLSADLWRDGTREWNCPELMLMILKPGMVCIEAGACLGFYALMEAMMVGSGGHVYAIEPNPNNVRILNKSVRLNRYKNISVHQLAIGDKDGVNEFLIEHRSNLGRILKTEARDIPEQAIVKTVKVKEQTLDSFVAEHGIGRVDLLRFDIESYELALIEGGHETLTGMPEGSWIFGEFHTIHFEDPEPLRPAIQSIIDHGFIPRHVVHMLDASGIPVTGMESLDPGDFARACVEDYPKSAPRVFFEKCR